MQLTAPIFAHNSSFADLVLETRLVKIYHVVTGRNAWHSTWITRYAEGSMHTSLSSAQTFAEKHRVQGTVFTIRELPAIAFLAASRTIITTEINSKNPFDRINIKKFAEFFEILPPPLLTVHQAFIAFGPKSPLWPENYPRVDSAISTGCNEVAQLDAITTDAQLTDYRSESVGPQYFLTWSKKVSAVNPASTATITSFLSKHKSAV